MTLCRKLSIYSTQYTVKDYLFMGNIFNSVQGANYLHEILSGSKAA